jgi:hypothetical protein
MVFAGGLMPLGFALSIVVARLNWAGTWFLWFASLGLPVLFLAIGVAGRTVDRLLTRSVRRDRARRLAADQQISAEISNWNRRIRDSSSYFRAIAAAPAGRLFNTGALVVAGLAVLVIVPVSLLAVAGTLGTAMTEIGLGSIGNLRSRIAAHQLLRRYRLETDPRISADSAGAALHVLISIDVEGTALPLAREPVRAYPDPWWPEGPLKTSLTVAAQRADSLVSRIRRADPQERAYFRRVAAHPAHREFAIVGRAGDIDLVATRWILPFPDSMNSTSIPIPRFGAIRSGAQAHVARAVLDAIAGNPASAERQVREVISTGFVMMEHGTTLIETLVGAAIVRFGCESLEQLYRMTGRRAEAESLAWMLANVQDLARAMRWSESRGEGELRRIAEIVGDSAAPAGVRWELFGTVNAFAPCASLHRIVYGWGPDYADWVVRARASLVRHAGDEQLFQVYLRGFLRGGCFPGRQFIGMFRAT